MTDQETRDINASIRVLAESVNDHKVKIAESVAVLSTKVDNLKESQDRLAGKVDTVATNQAACEARNGFVGQNARLKRLEKKSSDDRIHVESELRNIRDDATGQTDVAAARIAALTSEAESGSRWFVKTVGPMFMKGLLILGIGIGGGLVARIGTEDTNADRAKIASTVRYAVELSRELEKKIDILNDNKAADDEPAEPASTKRVDEEVYPWPE
jgi:outer membrane murein-binding lipoprotein Lpp